MSIDPPVCSADAADDPCVLTHAGWVRGLCEAQVLAFKGIPFAAPPVGELRFKPPQAVQPWAGVLPTQAFRSPEPQLADALETYAATPRSVPDPQGGADRALFDDEDCLYLNVWTPALDGGQRPVIVFLHGGAFQVGTASTEFYSGQALARAGAVLVTVNYRLGAFGFLELGALDPAYAGSGNNGLRDQIAALDWVRQNIAAFGGDPQRVTVCGESAGSMSVAALLATPEPQKLMRRAIGQSGGANLLHTPAFAQQAAQVFLAQGPHHSLAALLAASPRELLLQQAAAIDNYELGDSLFAPFVDGRLVLDHPVKCLASGHAAGIDLMVGATLDEMGYWTLYDAGLHNLFVEDWSPEPGVVLPANPLLSDAVRARLDAALAPDSLHRLYQRWAQTHDTPQGHRSPAQTAELVLAHDFMMIQPMTRLAQAQCAHHPQTYVYRFDWRLPKALLSDPAHDLGAVHALELPFMLGTLDLLQSGLPDMDRLLADPWQRLQARQLSDMMVRAWVNFACSGNPNGPGAPEWPAYTLAERQTLLWGNDALGTATAQSVADPDAERRLTWAAWDFPLYPWQA